MPAPYKNYKWNGDLYTCFYELAFNLVKEKGSVAFITPRFFLFNKDNFGMRKYFLENVNILSMVECKPFDAVTENEITILTKEKAKNNIIPFYSYFERLEFLNNYLKKWAYENSFLEINPYLSENIYQLLKKIGKDKILLSSIAKSKRGAEIGKKDLSSTTNGKPVLLGFDVGRFSIELTNAKIDISHKEYIRLKNVFDNKNVMLLRRVSKSLVATISENSIAFSKNLYGLIVENEKYSPLFVLALLNSKILDFYYKHKFSTKKVDVFPEIQTYLYEQLPVPAVSPDKQQPIISLVDKILSAKANNPQAETAGLENEIDALVFHLYGLTDEEIAIIEGR